MKPKIVIHNHLRTRDALSPDDTTLVTKAKAMLSNNKLKIAPHHRSSIEEGIRRLNMPEEKWKNDGRFRIKSTMSAVLYDNSFNGKYGVH